MSEQNKVEQEVKPVQEWTNEQIDAHVDELVKNAMEKSEEPTNFDKTTEEDKLVVDATSLMRELENYIRLVVNDEINKSK